MIRGALRPPRRSPAPPSPRRRRRSSGQVHNRCICHMIYDMILHHIYIYRERERYNCIETLDSWVRKAEVGRPRAPEAAERQARGVLSAHLLARPADYTWPAFETNRLHGQFSKVQSGKEMGPAPGRFELPKGILKGAWATVLGFETLYMKFCESKLWELTVESRSAAMLILALLRILIMILLLLVLYERSYNHYYY